MTPSTQNYEITSLSALEATIALLIPEHASGMIYLHGDLGTGKTTFVARWLKMLGYSGIVTSPTYRLINEYRIDERRIIHADLYRLGEAEELLYLDCDDWRPQEQLIFIEWPQQGQGYLPEADAKAHFTLRGKTRRLSWTNTRKR